MTIISLEIVQNNIEGQLVTQPFYLSARTNHAKLLKEFFCVLPKPSLGHILVLDSCGKEVAAVCFTFRVNGSRKRPLELVGVVELFEFDGGKEIIRSLAED